MLWLFPKVTLMVCPPLAGVRGWKRGGRRIKTENKDGEKEYFFCALDALAMGIRRSHAEAQRSLRKTKDVYPLHTWLALWNQLFYWGGLA